MSTRFRREAASFRNITQTSKLNSGSSRKPTGRRQPYCCRRNTDMGSWIDFKALRQQLRFADVLRHYNVEVKAKGNQHHGFCPLPNHNGKKNSQSFSANLEKGIFNCFGCGAKGNVLEFAAMMEGVSVESGAELRT